MTIDRQTHQLDIEGMTCTACASRIENVLSKDEQNSDVNVNFASRKARLKSSHNTAELQDAIAALGYKAVPSVQAGLEADVLASRELEQTNSARRRVALAFALALPVFVISMAGLTFPGSILLQLVLTSALLAGPGQGFFRRAAKQARHGQSSMDTLVALGTGAAYAYSLYLMARGHSHLYFESAAVIIALILLGKFLEERARQSISAAIRSLAQLQPRVALLIKERASDRELEPPQAVAVSSLRHGSILLVRPGDRIPVDGIVSKGHSSIDESMLTGESIPVDVAVGSKLSAGTLNMSSPLQMETLGIGANTELARIIRQVEAAQGTKAPIQDLADRIAGRFVPLALLIALCTLLAWMAMGEGLETALTAAVAVLVVACPCALGLATPTAIMVATGRAAQRGVLIKDASSLQTLHRATALVFDKTGTLTTGQLRVTELVHYETPFDLPRPELLALIRRIERTSSHPVAQAIANYCDEALAIPLEPGPSIDDVYERPGQGVFAKVTLPKAAAQLFIGKDPNAPSELKAGTNVVVTLDGKEAARFHLEDQLKSDTAPAVYALQQGGLKLIVASGDQDAAVNAVATPLGLQWHARQTPADKAALITSLRQAGEVVVMVGDGINDAPALAAADVGIAMGSGSDAAMQTAGITLKDASLGHIAETVALSQKTFTTIKQNLFWAFAYNIILIPAAAAGKLSPMLAAAAMALSSLFVVGNAARLSRSKLS